METKRKLSCPPGTIGITEAAPLLGYSVQHLQRLCKWGKIGCMKRGSHYFFSTSQLKAIFPLVSLPPRIGPTGISNVGGLE